MSSRNREHVIVSPFAVLERLREGRSDSHIKIYPILLDLRQYHGYLGIRQATHVLEILSKFQTVGIFILRHHSSLTSSGLLFQPKNPTTLTLSTDCLFPTKFEWIGGVLIYPRGSRRVDDLY